jgi:hypothetical protein
MAGVNQNADQSPGDLGADINLLFGAERSGEGGLLTEQPG